MGNTDRMPASRLAVAVLGCLLLAAPAPPSHARTVSELSARTGTLKLSVVGLPGQRALVRVKGKRSFTKKVRIRGKRTLRLRPGVYRVKASTVVVDGVSYAPQRRSSKIRVSTKRRARVVLRYVPAPAPPQTPSAPTVAPASPAPPGLVADVLERINAARADGVRCDGSVGPPLAPIGYSAELDDLARWHADDLVAGRDNDFIADLQRSGFAGAFVAETAVICPKVADADGVVKAMTGWELSCSRLFSPDVDRIGIAYAGDGGSNNTWVLTFGRSTA
jgi:hypothetical protein